MRKYSILIWGLVLGLGMLILSAGPAQGKLELKAGDQVYACGCGASCPCQTIASKAGKCHCGTDLEQVTVAKVGDGTADLKFGEETRTFKTVGKFACGCGEACDCKTISQSPGQCSCGKDLVAVEG